MASVILCFRLVMSCTFVRYTISLIPCTLLTNKIPLNDSTPTKWLLLERRHSVYHVLFIETKSDLRTQRNCRTKYGRNPPSRSSIRAWKFMETGTMFDKGRSGRSRISEKNIDHVRNRVPS
ncbi:uncharacterized protein LOC122533730 [Frieseomelitta varia]|uniref:uncharacterized protein LOC122533730 n=1 Tax=Frieseomelitta varia TaxID=561572 RepID=UPI001CB6A5B3|nr:uncharacterized protein LOC122533730 [Frieseomelitta varia]